MAERKFEVSIKADAQGYVREFSTETAARAAVQALYDASIADETREIEIRVVDLSPKENTDG